MRRHRFPLSAVAVVLVLSFAAAMTTRGAGRRDDDGGQPPSSTTDLPLVYQDKFERVELNAWDFTDPSAWRITLTDDAHKGVLEQYRQSRYQPSVRSPLNIALVRGSDLADFVLDVKVRSTARDYGHRDLCFFFGHQDASHFYYVHLGKQADAAANSIFLVNGKPRFSIAQERTKGTPWTDGWHNVRIIRRVKDGLIQVYFDDMKNPAMTAHDQTFAHGRVGLGSFDDTGMFDDLRIRGTALGKHENPERRPSG
jgi:hypothetical protein